MFEIRGKYNSAFIYIDDIDQETYSQIQAFLNCGVFKSGRIAIMPDCHAGKGAVIGFTAPLGDEVIPNVIGVDIGCGVVSWKLGKRSDIGESFDKLDKFIRSRIPLGRNIRDRQFDIDLFKMVYNNFINSFACHADIFREEVEDAVSETGQSHEYVLCSMGTLGGGNHFIEVDKDDEDNLWLTVHSGSRNFGLKIAEYHQKNAQKFLIDLDNNDYKRELEIIKKTKKGKGIETAIIELKKKFTRHKPNGLESLKGDSAEKYLAHMKLAQKYAVLNRQIMGYEIINGFYKLNINNLTRIESVHNYINFSDRIIRKGAISAREGEPIIIPLNMAEGNILGIGKGNKDWNCSAPHGAGRKLSRSKAKTNIRLEDYQSIMAKNKVWSSSVSYDTIDESPQAYKKSETIIAAVEPTIQITCRSRSIYNIKAAKNDVGD